MVDVTMENLKNPKGVGIIVIQNGQILLGKRKDSGLWGLAGGGIEQGEEPKQTAIRELFEEFGIKVSDLKYYGVTPSPANPFKPKDSKVGCSIEYFVEFPKDYPVEVKLQAEEMTDYEWADSKEILERFRLIMYPNSISSIELFLRQ
jgi:8-oxo-dGTP pyrophosphatase MutT (NUDIX family)